MKSCINEMHDLVREPELKDLELRECLTSLSERLRVEIRAVDSAIKAFYRIEQ